MTPAASLDMTESITHLGQVAKGIETINRPARCGGP